MFISGELGITNTHFSLESMMSIWSASFHYNSSNNNQSHEEVKTGHDQHVRQMCGKIYTNTVFVPIKYLPIKYNLIIITDSTLHT